MQDAFEDVGDRVIVRLPHEGRPAAVHLLRDAWRQHFGVRDEERLGVAFLHHFDTLRPGVTALLQPGVVYTSAAPLCIDAAALGAVAPASAGAHTGP